MGCGKAGSGPRGASSELGEHGGALQLADGEDVASSENFSGSLRHFIASFLFQMEARMGQTQTWQRERGKMDSC